MGETLGRLSKLLTPQRRKYPYFIGGALWLAWILNILLGLAFHIPQGKGPTDMSGHLIGTDYVAFYTAGKILLMGRGSELYSLELAHNIQQELYVAPSDNFNPYLNPPFYAWLFVPLAWLPYPVSAVIWMSLGAVLLWFSLQWLGLKKPWHPAILVLTWLPAFSVVSFGQNAFLSLAIFSLGYHLWHSNRRFLAGLVLSLAFYKPQFLLGVGLLWLLEWRKNWRGLVGMALGCGLLAGLSFLFLPEASMDYLRYSRQVAENLMVLEGFPMWNAHALGAFWLALLPDHKILAQVLYIVCALAGILFFLRFWKSLRSEDSILYAAAICLMVWITPYLMIYDWVLLLIPAVLLWETRAELRKNWEVMFALVWTVTFFSSALTYLQLKFFDRAIQISLPVLCLIFFWAYTSLLPSRRLTAEASV